MFQPKIPFQINATIAYPQLLPNALDNYHASSCNATITWPADANLSLAQGETPKKTLGTGFLQAGANSAASWMLTANSSIACNITVEVEGLISGAVGPHFNYTAYDYNDRIGAKANFTLALKEDSTSPIVGHPSRVPEDGVQTNQQVEVFVNVTDADSGVRNVTLYYSLNGSLNTTAIPMSYNSTSNVWNATIPGQPYGTMVFFGIVAYDNAGNYGVFTPIYYVVPEFTPSLVLPLFMVLSIPAILYVKKKALRKTKT
jgi:hypothetical protein